MDDIGSYCDCICCLVNYVFYHTTNLIPPKSAYLANIKHSDISDYAFSRWIWDC